MTAPADTTVDAAVAAQYRDYPYPPRDPADEARRLLPTQLGTLDRPCALFWGRRRTGLRVLDAGCGTGDAAVFIAATSPDATVVALDRSPASLGVARRRAAVRALGNLTFVEGSLLDLPGLGLGSFDYIVSSGVLHHLGDPLAGLQALVGVLNPDGGLGLMLYARHGRMPVYQLQDLLRRVGGGAPLEERAALARDVLAALPPRHFFKAAGMDRELNDVRTLGTSGVVDLLLHACDRAYTVDELYDLLGGAGLRLAAFHRPALYRPEGYPMTDAVRARAAQLDERGRQAVAELMNGRMLKHIVWAARAAQPPAMPAPDARPDELCPVLFDPRVRDFIATLAVAEQPFALRSGDGFAIDMPLTAADVATLREVDGDRTLAGVLHRAASVLARRDVHVPYDGLLVGWRRVAGALEAGGYLGYFRAPVR